MRARLPGCYEFFDVVRQFWVIGLRTFGKCFPFLDRSLFTELFSICRTLEYLRARERFEAVHIFLAHVLICESWRTRIIWLKAITS